MLDIQVKGFPKEPLKINMREGEKHLWDIFAPHHYMDHNLPQSCNFYTMYWEMNGEEILVGCAGILFQIAKDGVAKRFTRIVILPEYQGLGFGSKIVEILGSYYKDEGIKKLYLSTFHPRLGEYMKASNKWTASHNNLKEFKTNDKSGTKSMNGLRDGVSMYRYNFTGYINYDLIYNPVKITKLKKKSKLINRDVDGGEKEYKRLLSEIKKESLIAEDSKYEAKKVDLTSEEHLKAKELHKKTFKPKRRVLTSEERKAAKAKLKKVKDEK